MANAPVALSVGSAPGNVPKYFARQAAAILPHPMDNAFNAVVEAAYLKAGGTAPVIALAGNVMDTACDAAVQAAYSFKNGQNSAYTK